MISPGQTSTPHGRPGATVFGRSRLPAFTLIEVIASLVMVAILAAVLWPIWGTSLRGTVEGSSQLTAAYELRTEMENWIHQAKTEAFDDLPTLIGNDYQNDPDIEVAESDWVVFEEQPGNIFEEAVSSDPDPTDHLRVTLRHSAGHQLTFIFSRFEE